MKKNFTTIPVDNLTRPSLLYEATEDGKFPQADDVFWSATIFSLTDQHSFKDVIGEYNCLNIYPVNNFKEVWQLFDVKVSPHPDQANYSNYLIAVFRLAQRTTVIRK